MLDIWLLFWDTPAGFILGQQLLLLVNWCLMVTWCLMVDKLIQQLIFLQLTNFTAKWITFIKWLYGGVCVIKFTL